MELLIDFQNAAQLAIKLGARDIAELGRMPLEKLRAFLAVLGGAGKDAETDFSPRERAVAEPLLRAVTARLGFLIDVGLDYLSLDRSAQTLSSGEGQRIRLATQIGAALVGVLYVLDEPSVGLHARDNARLIEAQARLRDLGNTVLVVEHDREAILAADHVVDMGPGAGVHGGRVVAEGTPAELMANASSITGPWLSGKKQLPIPKNRKAKGKGSVKVVGARAHNLKNVNAAVPRMGGMIWLPVEATPSIAAGMRATRGYPFSAIAITGESTSRTVLVP